MNADSNKGFAASPRQIGLRRSGKTHPERALLAGAPATDRLVTKERTATQKQQVAVCLVSCVMAVTRRAWRPREHTWAPDIVDDRVQTEGASNHASYHFVVHEGGVHGPAQELLVVDRHKTAVCS